MIYQTNFSSLWGGKIFNEHFGTIRLFNAEKYAIGNLHQILYQRQLLGVAKVEAVRSFRFSDIRDVLAYLDSGLPAAKLAGMLCKMYEQKVEGGVQPHTVFQHVVFNWKKREFPVQLELLQQFFGKLQQQYMVSG